MNDYSRQKRIRVGASGADGRVEATPGVWSMNIKKITREGLDLGRSATFLNFVQPHAQRPVENYFQIFWTLKPLFIDPVSAMHCLAVKSLALHAFCRNSSVR